LDCKIMEIRMAAGMTQEELAEKSGVGRSTISDVETGRHLPRVDVAILLCRALGVAVEEAFKV
jgi:DNA-binding XRE family transcriptional regulator